MKRSLPRMGVAAAGAVLAAAAALLVVVPAQSQDPPLPDLIVRPSDLTRTVIQDLTFEEGSCSIVEGHVPGPGTYRLLRFTTTYPNIGDADLVIGNPLDRPDLFEYDTCHGHYHFKEYADYRLWTQAGYAAWNSLRAATGPAVLSRDVLNANPTVKAQMIEGAKRGFCIIDVVRYPTSGQSGGPPTYTSCATNQGISVGWADQYGMRLDGQWIVISGVAAGSYVLEVEVNAEHLFTEGDYANNRSAAVVAIPPVRGR